MLRLLRQHDSTDRYKATANMVASHGNAFWQSFGAMLLPHTILLAFLLAATYQRQDVTYFRALPIGVAVGGILFCILWRAAYDRSWTIYEYRIAQARECEPPDWQLLRGDAHRLSSGEEVYLGGTPYRIRGLARIKTHTSCRWLIHVFGGLYVLIIVFNCAVWSLG